MRPICALYGRPTSAPAADALAEAHSAYVRGDVEQGFNIVQGAFTLAKAPMFVMHRELKKEEDVDRKRKAHANREIKRNRLRVLGPKFKIKYHRGKLVEIIGIQYQNRVSGEVFYADIWEDGKITGTTNVTMRPTTEADDETIKQHYGGKPSWLK